MLLLIDGYNVLYAVGKGQGDSERNKRQFIQLVSSYARLKHHDALIVFDGGNSPFAHETKILGVRVVESGYQSDADTYIRGLFGEVRPEMVLVVSSDRAVTDDAEEHDIVSIDAQAFYYRALEVVCQKPQQSSFTSTKNGHKTCSSCSSDIDALMEQACSCVQPKKADLEDEDEDFSSKGHKKSRVEKRLERVIKKL